MLSAEISDEAIAKTHRKKIAKLFKVSNQESNIVGFKDSNEVLMKIKNLKELNIVKSKMQRYIDFDCAISAINNLSNFKPTIETSNNKDRVLKVKLLNFQEYETNNAVKGLFESICEKNKIVNYKEVNYSYELIIYKLRLKDKAIPDEI